jgi:hypothetical protein
MMGSETTYCRPDPINTTNQSALRWSFRGRARLASSPRLLRVDMAALLLSRRTSCDENLDRRHLQMINVIQLVVLGV